MQTTLAIVDFILDDLFYYPVKFLLSDDQGFKTDVIPPKTPA